MRGCDCLDYPVSWTFYRAHCIEQHGVDPGSNEIKAAREEIEVIEPLPDIRRLTYQVEQARAEVVHLRTKLAEHLAQQRRPTTGDVRGEGDYKGLTL